MGPRHSVLVLLPDLKKSFFSKIFCWDPNETTAFLYVEMAEKTLSSVGNSEKSYPPKLLLAWIASARWTTASTPPPMTTPPPEMITGFYTRRSKLCDDVISCHLRPSKKVGGLND